jgi:hypothetical protein
MEKSGTAASTHTRSGLFTAFGYGWYSYRSLEHGTQQIAARRVHHRPDGQQ